MKALLPLLMLCLLPALLPSEKSAPATHDGRLTFADEFNGSGLDLSLWAPHDPLGTSRDRQLQAWTADAVTVSDGQLHLRASHLTKANRIRYDGIERDYASGIVTTVGTFAQVLGRFETRCRVPAARGLHARFALMPVPLSPLPQIDIFEIAGSAPARIAFANRWGTEQTLRSYGDTFAGPDLASGFHTIAADWEPDRIVWRVDGKEIFRSVTGVPHQRMYLTLELSVGGGSGLSPDSTTVLPASFDIDYVRVYQGSPAP